MSWLGASDVAKLLAEQPTPRHVLRMATSGAFGAIKREGRRVFINSELLPVEARAALRLGHADLIPPAPDAPPDVTVYQFDDASPRQQQTATNRMAAVVEYELFLAEWGNRRGIHAAKQRWAETYLVRIARRAAQETRQPEFRTLSVDSLDRWLSNYRAYGRDGLVDGNDGHARRGKGVVPRRVREMFIARYTDGSCPTKAMVIEEVRAWAGTQGIDLDGVADDAFYRIKISAALLGITREDQDHEERTILTLRRDHNFPAMTIVVADHHLTDLWVHCGESSYVRDGDRIVHVPAAQVCAGECTHGHRVWITAWMDVASRKVLSWLASLDYPSAVTVRRSLRQLVDKYGLPLIVYVDNGKDFKSAFGRAIRRGEALPLDENLLNNLLASLGIRVIFATPRKGRSKSIERLFGTWCKRIWQGRPEYVGALGKRKESAKALYTRPQLMISLYEFREEMTLHVEAYELRRHGGQGMNGRSPAEVFDATRPRPQRQPEPNGFAIAFYDWYGRQVGPGGACTVGPDRYILDPIVAADRLGQNVQLLVNPDDVRHAIVISGCEHTSSRTSRTTALSCACPGKGNVLGEATFEGLSSYVEQEVTAEHLRERNRINRELRREARSHRNPAAANELERFRRGHALLRAIVQRRRAQQPAAAAMTASGETVVATVPTILPQSHIARRVDQYRAEMSAPRLRPDQLAVASTAVDQTEEFFDRLPARPRFPRVADHQDDDPIHTQGELQRVREERERRRKDEEGECLDCAAPVWAGKYCRDHHRLSE